MSHLFLILLICFFGSEGNDRAVRGETWMSMAEGWLAVTRLLSVSVVFVLVWIVDNVVVVVVGAVDESVENIQGSSYLYVSWKLGSLVSRHFTRKVLNPRISVSRNPLTNRCTKSGFVNWKSRRSEVMRSEPGVKPPVLTAVKTPSYHGFLPFFPSVQQLSPFDTWLWIWSDSSCQSYMYTVHSTHTYYAQYL